jgi:hypothetical protein
MSIQEFNLKILLIMFNFWRQCKEHCNLLLPPTSKKLTDCERDKLYEKMYF